MTGSALFDFLIAIVALGLIVFLIFLAIDRIAPDEFFKKVAKVAVGGIALIVMLIATKAVLFGGGGALAVSPGGVIAFAIGLLVVCVVLYVLYLAIDKLAPAEYAAIIKYVVGAVALIALLVLAGQVLFSGGGPRGFRPLSDGGPPFRAADPARAAADLRPVLTARGW